MVKQAKKAYKILGAMPQIKSLVMVNQQLRYV